LINSDHLVFPTADWIIYTEVVDDDIYLVLSKVLGTQLHRRNMTKKTTVSLPKLLLHPECPRASGHEIDALR